MRQIAAEPLARAQEAPERSWSPSTAAIGTMNFTTTMCYYDCCSCFNCYSAICTIVAMTMIIVSSRLEFLGTGVMELSCVFFDAFFVAFAAGVFFEFVFPRWLCRGLSRLEAKRFLTSRLKSSEPHMEPLCMRI